MCSWQALHLTALAEDPLDRGPKTLAPIEYEQIILRWVEAPADEVVQESLAHGQVLGGSLPEPQSVLLALGVYAHRYDLKVPREADPVNEQRYEVELREVPLHEFTELGFRGPQELTAHR